MTSRLVVSTGCPSGVGPEVSVAAVARLARGATALLLGDLAVLRERAVTVGVAPARLVAVASAEEAFDLRGRVGVLTPHAPLGSRGARPGRPSRAGGAAQLAYVDLGADLVRAGRADALVTGPVSKEAVVASGAPGARRFRGHTEHLMRRVGAASVTMAFWSRRLTTSLVTTHLPLARVPRAITREAVARAIVHTARFLARLAPAREVALAVAGLNPHAGEGGLLGREELERVRPAMGDAARELAGDAVRLEGPLPAETALRLAARGAFAGVVAMYHDQATIAMKLTGFGEAVNVSLGLPIVRTSVDHGTAYDVAGRGTASPRGMTEALALAVVMARRGIVTPAGPTG